MRIYRADGSVRSNLVVEARQEGRDIADQIRYWAGDLLISLVTNLYLRQNTRHPRGCLDMLITLAWEWKQSRLQIPACAEYVDSSYLLS